MRARVAALFTFAAFLVECGGAAPPAAAVRAPSTASASAEDASLPTPPESTPTASGPPVSSSPAGSASTLPPLPAPAAPPLMTAEVQAPSPALAPGPTTKRAGCKMRGALPDSACTPGAVMTKDLDIICHHRTHDRRHVGASVHKQAFTEYGYTFPRARGAFEVDHLIPLELGGDNTIENLWAEPASPKPGFHEKDLVENYLHKQVCSNAMKIDAAQKSIATDWLSVWKKMSGGGDAR
jgi:hypothetical protein